MRLVVTKENRNYLALFISKVNLIWSSHNDQITLDVGESYQPFGQGKTLSYALDLLLCTTLLWFIENIRAAMCCLGPDRAVVQSLCPRYPAQLRGMRGSSRTQGPARSLVHS